MSPVIYAPRMNVIQYSNTCFWRYFSSHCEGNLYLSLLLCYRYPSLYLGKNGKDYHIGTPVIRACEWSMCRAENRAERAKTGVERSGAVSGSQKNRAQRSGAERERENGAGSGLNLTLQRPLRQIFCCSVCLHVTQINRSYSNTLVSLIQWTNSQ